VLEKVAMQSKSPVGSIAPDKVPEDTGSFTNFKEMGTYVKEG